MWVCGLWTSQRCPARMGGEVMVSAETKTVDLVCLQHDRHWPCKKLEPGERPHLWAYRTITTAYAERTE